MKEYEIKGLSNEEIVLIVKSLLATNRASNDDKELDLINGVLEKMRKSVEAD